MSDLVCSSSACPDDIDPANAWECTDVHVRVYPPENPFSMAIAHRVTADAEPELTKETGFHPRTSALTKSFVEYRGYWLPHCFDNEGAQAEYHACRERAVVMDLSPLRKWEVLGPDAETLMQTTLTRDVRRLAVGQVCYTALCNETGGMIDDGTVFRLGEGQLPLRRRRPLRRGVAQGAGRAAGAQGVRQAVDGPAAQHRRAGPRSRDILREIVVDPADADRAGGPALVPLPRRARSATTTGAPIVVSRTGYTGELGYEVWCHPADGPAVWDAVFEAGAAHGITPLGLEALDIAAHRVAG